MQEANSKGTQDPPGIEGWFDGTSKAKNIRYYHQHTELPFCILTVFGYDADLSALLGQTEGRWEISRKVSRYHPQSISELWDENHEPTARNLTLHHILACVERYGVHLTRQTGLFTEMRTQLDALMNARFEALMEREHLVEIEWLEQSENFITPAKYNVGFQLIGQNEPKQGKVLNSDGDLHDFIQDQWLGMSANTFSIVIVGYCATYSVSWLTCRTG